MTTPHEASPVGYLMTSDAYGRPAEFYRKVPEFVPPISKLEAVYTATDYEHLRAQLREMTADRDSWCDQASERVKDWDEMRKQADALRSEVERLREELGEERGRHIESKEHFVTSLQQQRSRAEAAEARASWLADNLRSTLTLMKCDDEFIDKQINPPHLNAKGDEGSG